MQNGRPTTARKRMTCALALAAIAVPLVAGPAAATITTTEASKRAAAGVLKGSDLPGWTALTSGSNDSASGDSSCSGVKSIKVLASSNSQFTNGLSIVISGTEVAASATSAKNDFKSLKTSHVLSCIKNKLLADEKSHGLQSVSISRVTARVSGSDDSTGYRLTMKGTSNGVKLEIDGYVVQARVGQSEITVLSEKANSGSPSLSKTVGYAKTLAHRVRAA